MKKIIILILMVICIFGLENVKAETVNSSDLDNFTYVIGKYAYTRNISSETGYDGKLTTKRIMLASRTIESNNQDEMIIYYKTGSGSWINALTGKTVVAPETFEIEAVDLVSDGTITTSNPNYESYELASSKITGSTYVIGDYIYSRNSNESHNYDGKLTTQRIMLASRTITKDKENEMIIYYKTARGIWIDALTGEEVEAPVNYHISVVDLVNQKTEKMNGVLKSGQLFNAAIKKMSGNNNSTYGTSNDVITKIKKASSISEENVNDNNIISDDTSDIKIYAWYDNGTIYYYPFHYFDNVEKIYMNKNSSYMFAYLKNLNEIDLSEIDTSRVTNMSYMFSGCSSLTSIDLSDFDMSKVTSVNSMFHQQLSKLVTPKVNSTMTITLSDEMYDSNGNKYVELNESTPTNITLKALPIMLDGSKFNEKIKELSGTSDATFSTSNTTITKIKRETNLNNVPANVIGNKNNLVSLNNDADTAVYAWYNEGTIYYYSNSQIIYLNRISYYMFYKLQNLVEVDLSVFNTSKVTNMSYMFYGCSSLTTLDLSNFDTSKVTNMHSMFGGCSSLESLNASNFDTSNVTSMFGMFFECSSLASLNLSNFDTSNVTNMSRMFYNCSSLTTLDLSNFDTSKVTDMSDMFEWCGELTNVNLSSFDTSKVTNMSRMFNGCGSLTNLDLSNFDMSKVTNVGSMLPNQLGKLVTPKVNSTISITLPYEMYDSNGNMYTELNANTPNKLTIETAIIMVSGKKFNVKIKELSGASGATQSTSNTTITKIKRETNVNNVPANVIGNENNLVSLNNDVDTAVYAWYNEGTIYYYSNSQVIYLNHDSSNMFNYLKTVVEIDLNNFDTSKVTDMSGMFYSCSSLTTLDLSNFDTSKVTSMTSMFQYCDSLTTLDLSSFDTRNVTHMFRMFCSCMKLISINLSSFDTSNVKYMIEMFYGCSSLTNLNLSNFDTSNVLDMSRMFCGCSSLTSLDLSSFDMSKVTDVSSMLPSQLVKLVTPKVNSTKAISLPYEMFDSNGNGYTELNSSTPTNITLKTLPIMLGGSKFNVKIKELSGTSGASYLTSNTTITKIKRETNVNNVPANVIGNENNLVSLNNEMDTAVYAWYKNGIIYYYSNSQVINLNKDSSHMFYYLTKLNEIDLSNFNTSKVTDMFYMFQYCNSLTNLDLSSFDMSKVTSVSSMLPPQLVKLVTPKVNSTKAISLPYEMFDSNGNGYTELNESTPTNIQLKAPTIMISGSDFNIKIKELSGTSGASYVTSNTTITKIKRETNVNNVPANVIGNENNLVSLNNEIAEAVYAWYKNGIIYYYSNSQVIYLNQSSSHMFAYLKKLNEIDLSKFDTSKVTNMYSMFRNCSSFTNLDLSNFNTSNVTNMYYMFDGCNSLISLNLSNFDTSKVTGMYWMFRNCSSLTSLDLSNFDMSKVTSDSAMFDGMSSLSTLVTPKVNSTSTITLPKTMYLKGNSTGITSLTSTTPVKTTLKSSTW